MRFRQLVVMCWGHTICVQSLGPVSRVIATGWCARLLAWTRIPCCTKPPTADNVESMSSAQSELSLCKYVCARRMTPTHRKAVFGQRVFRLPHENSFSRILVSKPKTTSHYMNAFLYIFRVAFSEWPSIPYIYIYIYLQTYSHIGYYTNPGKKCNAIRELRLSTVFLGNIFSVGLSAQTLAANWGVPCCVAAYIATTILL